MKERWIEISEQAEENQSIQIDIWRSGKNISFISPEADAVCRRKI
jgi:hypothetical protein